MILIHSHIINNKVGGLRRIKGQRVSGIMIRVLYEESDRVRLHFFSACRGRRKEIKVFDSVRTVSCTIHLAVPGECCGLTLILAFSDRCGNCELTVSATGSVSSQFHRQFRYTFESLSLNAKRAIPFGMALLARDKGFEPLTFWSVARRSIQLS